MPKKVSEYHKEHVYITPPGILSNDQLEYIVKVMGADHVAYSLDHPYVPIGDAYGFLANGNLTDEEKELIAHKNAEKLLKI